MAGAIAGTAILHSPAPILGATLQLHTIALTVNNRCNLSCPHCYLQYRQPSKLPEATVLARIFGSSFKHLAVVGKEPLVDAMSAELCAFLARRCEASGRTISMITNGHGLHLLEPNVVQKFAYIDVSLDGGARTYRNYRAGSFETVSTNLRQLIDRGFDRFNALHVLNELTLPNLDDILATDSVEMFRSIMLQPYLVTHNDGVNRVAGVPLPALLRALSLSDAFKREDRAFLVVDGQHLDQSSLTEDEFLHLIKQLGIQRKIKFFGADPLLYGFLRVTYDGYVLSPLDSLHPALYRDSAVTRLTQDGDPNLDDLFTSLLPQGVETCIPM